MVDWMFADFKQIWQAYANSDGDNYSASASADVNTVHQQCIDFLSATFLHSGFSTVYWFHLFGFSSVHYDSDDEDALHQQCIDF